MKKLCFIFTGGTISMNSGTLEPFLTAEAFIDAVTELKTFCEIKAVQLFNIDSCEMEPRHWSQIAQEIYSVYEEYDGFVVVHGTDTMVYTACALSFMLQNLSKPVILTGSQIPLTSSIGTDARNNLIYSARFALSDIAEVAIFFGTHLLRGNRARKISALDIEAFTTFGCEPLGSAGVQLKLNHNRIKRKERDLFFLNKISRNIFLLKVFPGMTDGALLKLTELDVKGIVLEAYGMGNVPTLNNFIKEIKILISRGIFVVVCSQCEIGSALDYYPSGKKLKEAGAILVSNMTPECSFVKFAWAMANADSEKHIRSIMMKNIAREFIE